LCWMGDKTRHEMIMNDTIIESVGVTPILENKFMWLGHVERRYVDDVVPIR